MPSVSRQDPQLCKPTYSVQRESRCQIFPSVSVEWLKLFQDLHCTSLLKPFPRVVSSTVNQPETLYSFLFVYKTSVFLTMSLTFFFLRKMGLPSRTVVPSLFLRNTT